MLMFCIISKEFLGSGQRSNIARSGSNWLQSFSVCEIPPGRLQRSMYSKLTWPHDTGTENPRTSHCIRGLCLYNSRWARNSQQSESLKKPFWQAIILQWYVNNNVLSSISMPWSCNTGLVIQATGCNDLKIKKMKQWNKLKQKNKAVSMQCRMDYTKESWLQA